MNSWDELVRRAAENVDARMPGPLLPHEAPVRVTEMIRELQRLVALEQEHAD